jgi:hypothetical protein
VTTRVTNRLPNSPFGEYTVFTGELDCMYAEKRISEEDKK